MTVELSGESKEEPTICIRHLPDILKLPYYWSLELCGDKLGTIEWDEEYLRKQKIDTFRTFLLGGCASPTTLRRFEDFAQKFHWSGTPLVIALELESILHLFRLRNTPSSLVRGDLLSAPLSESSVDYVRLDYLQTFIPPEDQVILLNELKRILSPHGIISSVLWTVPKSNPAGISFPDNRYFGSRYASIPFCADGMLLLSEFSLEKLCTDCGLTCEIQNRKKEVHWTGKNIQVTHVVMRKRDN